MQWGILLLSFFIMSILTYTTMYVFPHNSLSAPRSSGNSARLSAWFCWCHFHGKYERCRSLNGSQGVNGYFAFSNAMALTAFIMA